MKKYRQLTALLILISALACILSFIGCKKSDIDPGYGTNKCRICLVYEDTYHGSVGVKRVSKPTENTCGGAIGGSVLKSTRDSAGIKINVWLIKDCQ